MITGLSALNFLESVKNCLTAAGGGDLDVFRFLQAMHEYDLDIVQIASGREHNPSEFGFLNERTAGDPPFSEG